MLIYIHVPFCTRKCDYCHFYVIPDKEPFKKLYMEGLALEWQQWLSAIPSHEKIETVYFGGGTPALLGPENLAQILEWMKKSSFFPREDIEITLEANPENVQLNLFRDYKAIGINRISIGVQAFDDALLQSLGRTHNAEKASQAVETIAQAGFQNISIDLMYDLPHQTLKHWQDTLKQATALPITHLSLYNLTFEPHTVFYKKRSLLTPLLPDPEISTGMYLTAIDHMAKAGFSHYEISAFAKPTFQAQHNSGYWTGCPFLGYGPSAFSYWKGKRFRNAANLHRYVQALKKQESPIDFEEQLPYEEHQRELLAIELRLLEGVDISKFEKKRGILPNHVHETLQQLQRDGFLKQEASKFCLTQKGVLFYDTVASEIV